MTDLKINDQTRKTDVPPETPLLWVLRDELGMTGTKFGCGMALCGACTVYLDGKPVRGCVTPLAAVGGQAVTTIEGLQGRVADAVRAGGNEGRRLDPVKPVSLPAGHPALARAAAAAWMAARMRG